MIFSHDTLEVKVLVIVIISAVYGGEYCNIYTKWYKLRQHEVRETMCFADNSEGRV